MPPADSIFAHEQTGLQRSGAQRSIDNSQMLEFGKRALLDGNLVLKSARHVQRELPKRLARRLMDLQLLPYIVVTNPYIRKV